MRMISITLCKVANLLDSSEVLTKHPLSVFTEQRFQPYKIFMSVMCASIDNTEHLKRWRCPEAFGGGRSRYHGDLWTAKNQRIKKAWLQFDLWPLKIKRSGASEGNDHMIKHFLAIKKAWLQLQKFQQATYKWLPLAVADWINRNDQHLDLARCGWLTILHEWAGEPCKIQVSPMKYGWIGRSDRGKSTLTSLWTHARSRHDT